MPEIKKEHVESEVLSSPGFERKSENMEEFEIPLHIALKKYDVNRIMVSPAVVSVNDKSERILLLQPKARPNCWDLPRTKVEFDDPTVLHAVAKTLWNTTGLTCDYINCQIGIGAFWDSTKGNRLVTLTFLVDAKELKEGEKEHGLGSNADNMPIFLNPQNHTDHWWATKSEIQDEWRQNEPVIFTGPGAKEAMIGSLDKADLNAFVGQIVDDEFKRWFEELRRESSRAK